MPDAPDDQGQQQQEQTPPPAQQQAGGEQQMAVDSQGNSLGYPSNTPTAQMTDPQRAAYWQHQSQKHEGRFKNLVGDKSYDDTKAALEAYAKIQHEQQTPAEQALADATEAGKKAGQSAAYQTAATAIFEGALLAGGVSEADAAELVKSIKVDAYVGDQGIDIKGLTSFAQRFKSGTGTSNTGSTGASAFAGRSFGQGAGSDGNQPRGAAGKAEAERRFGKKA